MTDRPTSQHGDELVRLVIEDEIAIIELNRPEKRNALSLQVVAQMRAHYETLPETVKVVILTGAGEHFSAGLDLTSLSESTAAEGIAYSQAWYDAFGRMQFGRVPVVAVLRGAVVGGGLELASTAHIRVAEASAYFALPEGQRGIFLGGGGSVRVTKLIGFSRVTDMMLTGRVVDAEEARTIGLVHYTTPAGEGLARAREIARKIASNAPLSNFAIMSALPLIAEQPMAHGLLTESLMATITQSAPEAKERVRAFIAKKAAKVVPDTAALETPAPDPVKPGRA